jgi:DNA polymerase elongation subunit (family B)
VAKSRSPKILHLDIETRPALAYVWRGYKENIGPDQIKEPDGIICWAAKWHGQKGMKFAGMWTDKDYLKKLKALLIQADAVVTYNGDKFDLPKIRGQLLRYRLGPLPKLTSIDLYKYVRRLGLFSARLIYICEMLGIGTKIKHHGFRLWTEVLEGKASAQNKMRRYNKQDVKLLEELYEILLPYLDKHPRLKSGVGCSRCDSLHVTSRGYYYTATQRVARTECQSCGKWDTGKRSKT